MMGYLMSTTTGVTVKRSDYVMQNSEFNPIFSDFGANTNQPLQVNDESIEQRARRVYGTSEQQAIKAGKITGSNILVEPFTSCLVASEKND